MKRERRRMQTERLTKAAAMRERKIHRSIHRARVRTASLCLPWLPLLLLHLHRHHLPHLLPQQPIPRRLLPLLHAPPPPPHRLCSLAYPTLHTLHRLFSETVSCPLSLSCTSSVWPTNQRAPCSPIGLQNGAKLCFLALAVQVRLLLLTVLPLLLPPPLPLPLRLLHLRHFHLLPCSSFFLVYIAVDFQVHSRSTSHLPVSHAR